MKSKVIIHDDPLSFQKLMNEFLETGVIVHKTTYTTRQMNKEILYVCFIEYKEDNYA